MKTTSAFLTLALALGLSACDKPSAPSAVPGGSAAPAAAPAAAAVDPKAAFATSLNAIGAEVTGLEKTFKGNPMEMMKKLPDILTKLDGVSTDGLPADLTAAFNRLRKNAAETGALIQTIPADLPTDPSAIGPYLQAHPEALTALQGLQEKMGPIKLEGEIARKELQTAAAASGIDIKMFIKAGEEPSEAAPEPAPAPDPAQADPAPATPADSAPAPAPADPAPAPDAK
ncbi:MAG: hypothetical protein JWL81_2908 [Verrucomicrobiales bacterium]|nr:hypothetical protein [Verrucomicrobiales bacterium]